MYHKTLSDGFFLFAVLAIFLAMVGWGVTDVWLASTQWLEVAIVMLLVAIYVRMSAEDDEKLLQQRAKARKAPAKGRVSSKHVSFKLTQE